MIMMVMMMIMFMPMSIHRPTPNFVLSLRQYYADDHDDHENLFFLDTNFPKKSSLWKKSIEQLVCSKSFTLSACIFPNWCFSPGQLFAPRQCNIWGFAWSAKTFAKIFGWSAETFAKIFASSAFYSCPSDALAAKFNACICTAIRLLLPWVLIIVVIMLSLSCKISKCLSKHANVAIGPEMV